ncbi:MAG: formate dehydrogenase accessory sulfurtransferase FdhD, partial [Anaerolineales bacterium]
RPSSLIAFTRFTAKGQERISGQVIGETRCSLYVNRQEIVAFSCTPQQLHLLALGFLRSEGLIAGMRDISMLRVYEAIDRVYWYVPALGLDQRLTMRICPESVGVVDVRLHRPIAMPTRRVLTSGCGGGITFDDLSASQLPVYSSVRVTAGQILDLMRLLTERASLYRTCRGVHTSLFSNYNGVVVVAEDIGRHNTLDKIQGACLKQGLETRDGILVSTGRVSSEMITKAARMMVPVVVSRSSPTALSCRLALEWGITLIGYARGRRMTVYTGGERVVWDPAPAAAS